MSLKVEGTYFDGQSSAARFALVTMEEQSDMLVLQSIEHEQKWQIKDLEFERYGSVVELRNKRYSGAILKVDNDDFADRFYKYMKQHKRVDIHARLLQLGYKKLVAISVGLMALIVVAYFYLLPPLAERAVGLLPDSFDDTLGDMFTENFLEKNDIDHRRSEYLTLFARELNLQNNKPLKFAVVKSKEMNAFAAPNGQIVVYSALVDSLRSAEELAALLGHEASHVNQRHSVKMLSRNLAGYMMISLLISDVNGIMTVIADNVHQLNSLSYSRKFEEEADYLGLKILMDNGLDPQGMVRLFERLEAQEKFSIPQLLSTHPLTAERKKKMQDIIDSTPHHISSNTRLYSLFRKLKNR